MDLTHRAGALTLVALASAACLAEPGYRLISYRVVGDGIPASLTREPGDLQRGRAIAINSTQGNCAVCHRMPIAEISAFGDVGPPLDGVGARLTEAQLRLRLVNARKLNPGTVMPAYYRVEGLHRVAMRYRAKPVLDAQGIEDVVAYLGTLK